jgi:hypothetical protein
MPYLVQTATRLAHPPGGFHDVLQANAARAVPLRSVVEQGGAYPAESATRASRRKAFAFSLSLNTPTE